MWSPSTCYWTTSSPTGSGSVVALGQTRRPRLTLALIYCFVVYCSLIGYVGCWLSCRRQSELGLFGVVLDRNDLQVRLWTRNSMFIVVACYGSGFWTHLSKFAAPIWEIHIERPPWGPWYDLWVFWSWLLFCSASLWLIFPCFLCRCKYNVNQLWNDKMSINNCDLWRLIVRWWESCCWMFDDKICWIELSSNIWPSFEWISARSANIHAEIKSFFFKWISPLLRYFKLPDIIKTFDYTCALEDK